jgi:hypothetical protein
MARWKREMTDLRSCVLGKSIALSPETRCAAELLIVGLIHVGHLGILWVARLRRAEERLQGEQSGLDSQCRRPLVLQYVQADGASLRRDIGMPDCEEETEVLERRGGREETFGDETHLGRAKGIVCGDHNVHFEDPSCVGSVGWSVQHLTGEGGGWWRQKQREDRRYPVEVSHVGLSLYTHAAPRIAFDFLS